MALSANDAFSGAGGGGRRRRYGRNRVRRIMPAYVITDSELAQVTGVIREWFLR